MSRIKSRSRAGRTTGSRGPSVTAGLGRLISWHRRKLAVLCAMAATAAGIVASPPAPPADDVVVSTHRLTGGAKVAPGDVAVRQVPVRALPHGAVSDPAAVTGRTLVAPVAEGAMLTKLDVLTTSTMAGPGKVIAPVRIADSAVIKLLRIGDRVDVLAADPESGKPATMIAKRARVVTIPDSDESGSGFGVASRGSDRQARLLLVEVSASEATALADAATGSRLSLLLG